MAREIALLERRRAFAFRRTNFVRSLAGAAAGAATEEAASQTLRAAVRRELGWSLEGEFQRSILDRLQPVGRLVWQSLRGEEAATPPAIQAALEAFEAWFETTHGSSFYALFDQEAPEVALVET
jgi:hypothetical protein